MFVLLHQLPLPLMFAFVLISSLVVCWAVIGLVRFAIPLAGFQLSETLPIRDSIVGTCTAIFGLMVAFSAAGIWNDSLSARNAVQREADAVENVFVLAAGLPDDVLTAVRDNLKKYVKSVRATDWPAMANGARLEDPVFDVSESFLIQTIDLLSRQQQQLRANAALAPLLDQLLEVRHARLARLASSNTGITWAQWIAIMIISTTALTAIALCNSHSFRMQIAATHLFVLVVSAAYFVILAHERPFIGTIAVQPLAFESLAVNSPALRPVH